MACLKKLFFINLPLQDMEAWIQILSKSIEWRFLDLLCVLQLYYPLYQFVSFTSLWQTLSSPIIYLYKSFSLGYRWDMCSSSWRRTTKQWNIITLLLRTSKYYYKTIDRKVVCQTLYYCSNIARFTATGFKFWYLPKINRCVQNCEHVSNQLSFKERFSVGTNLRSRNIVSCWSLVSPTSKLTTGLGGVLKKLNF